MYIVRSKGTFTYPADFLEKASVESEEKADYELNCEPFFITGKPYWAFDNYRCNGAPKGASHLFYTQPGWGKNFGEENAKCVTYACDPEIHKPVDVEKEFDVGFIGGSDDSSSRGEYLETIKSNFNFLIRSDVPTEDLGREYSRCKIIFNHIRFEEINIRFFEALAIGAQVCTFTPALHYFATEDVHYLSFRTKEEAVDKINFLLKHPEIRNKMTKDARKHVIENHTYKHRLKEMVLFLKGSNV